VQSAKLQGELMQAILNSEMTVGELFSTAEQWG
jgi:hypothetical protein